VARQRPQGWHGWDEYAPFYDWENAQTLGRRDVPFWRRVTANADGEVLELGCGTGRVTIPLVKSGVHLVVSEEDLAEALESVARVLMRGGTFGIDLVPDVPNWREYDNKVQLRGHTRAGARLTLVESVRQDRRRRLTIFQQEYIERRGRHEARHRFELTFRTLTIAQMRTRLERAGFYVDSVLGDYRGRPWDSRADVWIILAKKG
jgi:SAM-dependent methyltransferase